MAQEIEAKYKVESFTAVVAALRKAGAKSLGGELQTDQFFDTPDGRLRRGDCGLRIRTVRSLRGKAGKGALVTFKGPRARKSRVKARREVQTRVENAGAMAEVFRACGLVSSLKIRKRRVSYLLGGCRVELDELPRLGRFVEIEARTPAAVHKAARRLGLKGEPICESYVGLLKQDS